MARLATDPQAELCVMFLKLYQQSPHAEPGQIKANDPDKYLHLSAMYPGEWFDFIYGQEPMMTVWPETLGELWVHDPEANNSCGLDEFVPYFYKTLLPAGWSLGLSPMALFESNRSLVYARCLQLDLEAVHHNYSNVTMEMRRRVNRVSETDGFLVSSSPQGMHWHFRNYYPNNPEGFQKLAELYGCALLLNRENNPPNVDSRSIGHQLRSFGEDWCWWKLYQETGSLRVTPSIMKTNLPTYITNTP